jgi:hypothetical protein
VTVTEAAPPGGVRDDVDLFGWPEQTFGCRHMPDGDVLAGVVVCLPQWPDSVVDDGRAARLGRRLARAGVAVQRYHHRGSPASDGDPAAVSFASLVADAERAVDLLRERTGVERIGLVGARLGALVAARVARGHRGVPVALWEPVVDPRHAVEQAARARGGTSGAPGAGEAWHTGAPVPPPPAGGDDAPPGSAPASAGPSDRPVVPPAPGALPAWVGGADGLVRQPVPEPDNLVLPPAPPPAPAGAGEVGGSGDAGGYGHAGGYDDSGPTGADRRFDRFDLFDTQLCADLVFGGAVGTLPDELGDGPGPLLVVQTGDGTGVRPGYLALADECRARHRAVEVVRHPCDGWRRGTVVPVGPAENMIEATASWLTTHLLAAPLP